MSEPILSDRSLCASRNAEVNERALYFSIFVHRCVPVCTIRFAEWIISVLGTMYVPLVVDVWGIG